MGHVVWILALLQTVHSKSSQANMNQIKTIYYTNCLIRWPSLAKGVEAVFIHSAVLE